MTNPLLSDAGPLPYDQILAEHVVPGCEQQLANEAAALADLEWLGLDWDGPVVRQSERLDVHAPPETVRTARRLLEALNLADRTEPSVHFTEVETLFEDLQAETLLGRGALTYDD